MLCHIHKGTQLWWYSSLFGSNMVAVVALHRAGLPLLPPHKADGREETGASAVVHSESFKLLPWVFRACHQSIFSIRFPYKVRLCNDGKGPCSTQ